MEKALARRCRLRLLTPAVDHDAQQDLFGTFSPEVGVHKSPPDVVFQRSLRSGKDVFGQPQKQPGLAFVAINRSAAPHEIQLPDRLLKLNSYGCLLEIDKRRVIEV